MLNGYDLGLFTPNLKLYELDANTLSLENLAGGTYKNILLGGLKSGATNGNTLTLSANDTTFITLTTGVTDVCTLENVTLKGTLLASGTVTIPAVTLGGTVTGAAQTLSNLGTVYIGDTANAKSTLGLTINQGANDDEVLAFKSSDVAHGVTTLAETDTYGDIKKSEADYGGVYFYGYKEAGGAASVAMQFAGFTVTAANTTKSTAGRAIVEAYSARCSGTGVAAPTANENIFAIRHWDGASAVADLIVDEDGDLWLNGGITAGAATPVDYVRNYFSGNFTSGGASTAVYGQAFDGTITSTTGDTSTVAGMVLSHALSLGDNVALAAQVYVKTPTVTLNGFTSTVAATVAIEGAPATGTSKYALHIASGNLGFGAAATISTSAGALTLAPTGSGTFDSTAFTNTAAANVGRVVVNSTNAITLNTGTVPIGASLILSEPNFTIGTGALTIGATLAITGAPTEGGTNYAAYIASGGLGLGVSATPQTLTYNGNKALAIYTTCGSTDGSTSYEPILINNILTGAGQVGGRVKVNMSTDVALGSWANAFKAQVECNTNGRASGLLSAGCFELVLPASDVSGLGGNYAPVESELNCPASHVSSPYTAFMFMSTGGDATAITAWNAVGALFTINGLTAATSATNVFHTTGAVSATHGLRVRIDGVDYDILLKASTYA